MVADHSKWNVVGLAGIASLDRVDVLVTDSGLSRKAQRTLENLGAAAGGRGGRIVSTRDDARTTGTPPTPLARHLHDGREILYYDDTPPYVDGAATDLHDSRPPAEPEPAAGQMRYDPLTGEWVAIAAARQDRAFLPPADECPLCPTAAAPCRPRCPPTTTTWWCSRTASPSFDPVAACAARPSPPTTALGPRPRRSVAARCVCFTSEHDATFADLTADRGPARSSRRGPTARRRWARCPASSRSSASRTAGEAIGVTLHHPHGQIYAYPYVTARTRGC